MIIRLLALPEVKALQFALAVTLIIGSSTGTKFKSEENFEPLPPEARNYIFSIIWRCCGPKWDILDYWGTNIFCILSYYILSKDKGL